MAESESQVTEENSKNKRSKLFRKVANLFLGASLATSLGYADYRYQYHDPISRGVNISQLFSRYYETGDLRGSVLDMFDDSNYDGITKSWLVNVTQSYKDIIKNFGPSAISEAIADEVIPSPAKISEIITIEDEEQRRTAILVQSKIEKNNQFLIHELLSEEFRSEISALVESQKPDMTLSDVIAERRESNGLSPVPPSSVDQESLLLVKDYPDEIKTSVAELLFTKSNTIISNNNESRSFESGDLQILAHAIKNFYDEHGLEATQFFINSVKDTYVARSLLPNNIARTQEIVLWMYQLLKEKDQVTLQYFLGTGTIPAELVFRYEPLMSDLLSSDSSKNIVMPASFHDILLKKSGGDQQLATYLFFDYLADSTYYSSSDFPDTDQEFKDYLDEHDNYEFVREYNLDLRTVGYLTEISRSMLGKWDEQMVRAVARDPQLFKLPVEYYMTSLDQPTFQKAYKKITDLLPDSMTASLRDEVASKISDLVEKSAFNFSAADLEKLLNTEVKEFGENVLVEVNADFSLSGSNKSNDEDKFIDVPLVLDGWGDNFIAYDESSTKLTPGLESISGEELLQEFSSYHFLFVQDGVMKYGSIEEILSNLPSFSTVSEMVTELKKLNITSLTRVLPVAWENDQPVPTGHTSRINGEAFAGLVVVTKADQTVTQQYVVILSVYQLTELHHSQLSLLVGASSEDTLDLLLPDAGISAEFGDSKSINNMLTHGVKPGNLQGVRFEVK